MASPKRWEKEGLEMGVSCPLPAGPSGMSLQLTNKPALNQQTTVSICIYLARHFLCPQCQLLGPFPSPSRDTVQAVVSKSHHELEPGLGCAWSFWQAPGCSWDSGRGLWWSPGPDAPQSLLRGPAYMFCECMQTKPGTKQAPT